MKKGIWDDKAGLLEKRGGASEADRCLWNDGTSKGTGVL